MSKSADSFDDSDGVCSFGMKLTWDINDPKLPRDIKQYDTFQEWTDGYVRFIYNREDKNAQRHLSGWAMRNTNNHNCQILKKSCLGVVVCGRNCTLADGCKIQLRPAICDKARQKQQKKVCPSCDSPLELIPCRGHSGYPVTNFWRLEEKAVFFQAKGVHDHPRPESKSETENRRTTLKRRMTSSPFNNKKRHLESEAGRIQDPGVPFPSLQHLSYTDVPDRFSLVEHSFPLQAQPYPSFPNPDPYRFCYDPAAVSAEPISPHLGSDSYASLCKEPCSASTEEGDCSKAGAAPLHAHNCDYAPPGKHQGWKAALGRVGHGDWSGYVPTPSGSNHHYYNSEYLYRYPGDTSGSAASPRATAPVQTVITTTTKVSYQPCNPAAVKYGENLSNIKSTTGCDSLQEADSPPSYPGLKISEDAGVIKSAVLYEQESLAAKLERVESLEAYRCRSFSSCSYPERILHSFKYDGGEY